jgi:hypothetical protein
MSMSMSKEQQLWDTCSIGNLSLVESIIMNNDNSELDVNWIGPEKGDAPLHRACRFGWIDIVKFFLRKCPDYLQLDLNKGNAGGASPFYIACQEGHAEVVKVMMDDARIDVNHTEGDGATPLYVACSHGQLELVALLMKDARINVNAQKSDGFTAFNYVCQEGFVDILSLLLRDERIDINLHDVDERTPLYMASQIGQLGVVQHLLASGREINITKKSIPGGEIWQNKTPKEMARLLSFENQWTDETEQKYLKRKANCPLIADLLESFEADPRRTRAKLRLLPGIRDPFIGEVFAMIVFLADDFVTLKPDTSSPSSSSSFNQPTRRFFRIALTLPMDLQMVLCNRLFTSGKDIVLGKHSEPAFRKLGKASIWII